MHHRLSGLLLIPLQLRRSQLMIRRPVLLLLVSTLVLLVAAAIPLIVPARAGAAETVPAPGAVDASGPGPLSHGESAPSTGVGAVAQPDGQAVPEPAQPPTAGDEPLAVTDREVLHKVKQAGLWEMPVGMWASERAVDPRVREVGGKIAAEHQELDGIVNKAAARLGVELPTEPTPEQQGWLREIDAARGAAFDERAVFLLRQAHGNVLPVLTQVRVATRNAVIREFTTEAMAFVERHIGYLESTGLVRYDELPDTAALTNPDWRSNALTFVLFALVAAAFTIVLLLVGRALAGIVRALTAARRGRTTRPRATAGGHYARSGT
jgi:predicted outer membrane protein